MVNLFYYILFAKTDLVKKVMGTVSKKVMDLCVNKVWFPSIADLEGLRRKFVFGTD